MESAKINMLVAKAKQGNEMAFKLLLDEFEPMIMNTIKPYFAPGHDRSDIIQEGIIAFWSAVQDYDPKVSNNSHFAGFAKMVVNRRVKTFITMCNRQKHMFLNNALSLDRPVKDNQYKGEAREMTLVNFVSASPSPEELYIQKESDHCWEQDWEQFLNEMTELELKVFKAYLDGKKYREIAAEIGRSEKAVDNALYRVKQKFYRLIEQRKSEYVEERAEEAEKTA